MAIDLDKLIQINNATINSSVAGTTEVGLFLTTNAIIPFNATQKVLPFTDADQVGAYFGTSSVEYTRAVRYFKSYDGSLSLPPFVWYARYVNADIAPYTRGGALVLSDLTTLQGITSGSLTVNFNGTGTTISAINFSADGSFSVMAARVQTALIAAGLTSATCTYSSTTQAFTISNGVTTGTSTVAYCSVTAMATAMKVTQATGAVLSQGSVELTPAENLDGIVAVTKNWTSFTNLFDLSVDPTYSVQFAFMNWVIAHPLYIYILWTTESNLLIPGNTSNIAYDMIAEGLATLNPDGTITYTAQMMPNFGESDLAAALMGFGASINYTQQNAVINFAGKSQDGLIPLVTTNAQYESLTQKSFNFYGQFNSRSTGYNFTENGSIGGQYKFIDNVYNQIWLGDQIQNSTAALIQATKKLPYNETGYNTVKSTINGVMQQAIFNGVAETGNTFNSSQTAALIQQAGTDITQSLTDAGYYIKIIPATPDERIARAPVLGYVWYTNGSAINKFVFNVTFVQ